MPIEADREINDSDLVAALQEELEFYKTEQSALRKEIEILVESHSIPSATITDNFKHCHKCVDVEHYKRVSDEAIKNLTNQNILMDEEKLTYHQLWKISQQTIENLEQEITEYIRQSREPGSILQLKATIREFEARSNELKAELNKEQSNKMSLQKSKQLCEEKLNTLDAKYNDLTIEHQQVMGQLKSLEQILRDNRIYVASLKRERDEYERQYRTICEIHKNYKSRELTAYEKIQEALNVAEMAIKEKNAALEREKEVRDESEQLALTIGRVMEEASNKVDADMTNYAKRMKKTEDVIKKLVAARQSQNKSYEIALNRIKVLETQNAEIMKTSSKLDVDLQIASKTIIELEMKLQAYQKLIAREQEIAHDSDTISMQLQLLLDNNRKIKIRWKKTFDEMAEKLQNELRTLRQENAALTTENERLKNELHNS